MLPNVSRSQLDRFSYCYLHVKCQYRENGVIWKYIFLNIINLLCRYPTTSISGKLPAIF